MSYRIHYLSWFLWIIAGVAYGIEPASNETTAVEDWWDGKSVYVGGGFGQSYIDSKLNADEYSIGHQFQNAWKLSAGLDINKYFSIESFYAVLGSEEFNPGAGIGQRILGVNAIVHYWAYGSERMPGSFALYAKAGLTHQTNNISDVRYKTDTKVPLMGGVGAELYLPEEFSVRLELESYDIDDALVSFNIVKRFGFKARAPIPKKPIIKKVTLTPVIFDIDLDGVLDDEDQCLNTPEGSLVDQLGCATH